VDTLRQLRYRRQRLLRLQTVQELCVLVGQPEHLLQLLAAMPPYNEFTVQKRDGSPRFIEDPQPRLKAVLRSLNSYLQAVYYFDKPDASYGFITMPKDDPAPPRHIVTHAERHLGCQWLMNIDLEDFFHQVTTADLADRLANPPFQFDDAVVELLARLTSYKGRLPMGSPTSPVLSNLVFQPEDRSLETWAEANGWRYTRYADDLTFSSDSEITPVHFMQTIHLLENHGYRVHPRKRRLCGPDDVKSVTRLVLAADAVQLPEDFHNELNDLIEDLRRTTRVQHRMGEVEPPWLVKYRQRVQGMVGFAQHVLGDHDEDFHKIRNAYLHATVHPQEDFGAYSWLDFPYWET
jgi:RNA-directed DNA polymerase